MNANWLSRALAAAGRLAAGLWDSSPEIRGFDDPWYPDTDDRRMRHELDAIHSRFDERWVS